MNRPEIDGSAQPVPSDPPRPACPACRRADTVRVGLGASRRCRDCGHRWIGPPPATTPRPSTTRPAPPRSRARDGLDALTALQQLPLAGSVRAVLRVYLERALPGHARDEGVAWTLRALPRTGARKHWRRLFTVTVSNMEVLYAGYDPATGQQAGGVLVVEAATFTAATKNAATARAARGATPAPYVTAQGRALSVPFADLDELMVLLTDPPTARAAVALTTWLRRTAQVPSLQAQWHVPAATRWVSPASAPN